LYARHTRRLIAPLSQVTIALVVLSGLACTDGGPYAQSGAAGSGSVGAAGAGGSCDPCGGTSGAAGSGGTGDTGTAGTFGAAGSIGGSTGDATGAGVGGSIGGAVGRGGTGGPVTVQPWPSAGAVVSVDSVSQFSNNLSDLVYEPAAGGGADVLWGVQNDPSVLYCLLWGGATWSTMTDDGWTNGKALRYPGGTGSPDAEGLTRAEWSSTAIYVASERNNSDSMVSRLSVLRYDYTAVGTSLTATDEWNLTKDLPAAGANLGLEGIAWVPDSFLTANAFFDEAANAAYDPGRYPNHGTGLFFVGLENNGMIYGFALDHGGTGAFQRVATITSGHNAIMSLDFDRDEGNLWAYCDNTCANQAAVLRIGGDGRFAIDRLYTKPASLADSNNEGITIAPESECDAQGFRSFFWSDDSDYGGHAIYRGSIPCGPLP
jgi:hypothetical protein